MSVYKGQRIEIDALCAQWLTILNTSDICYNITRTEGYGTDTTNYESLPDYFKNQSYTFDNNGTEVGIINESVKTRKIQQEDYLRLNEDIKTYFNLSTHIVYGDILDADGILRDYNMAMHFMNNNIKYFVGVNASSEQAKPETCISAIYVKSTSSPQYEMNDITFDGFLKTPNVQIINYRLSDENT